MVTIRQALLFVGGEDANSISPIVAALTKLGFDVDAEVGGAFRLLNAEQAAGLTVRQQLALKAAIQAAATAVPPPAASFSGGFPTPEAKARERVISTYVVVDKARQRIFTPIFKRILVTYCHGSKSDLQPGQEIEVWANDSDGDMQQLVKARVLGLYPRSQILLCSTAKPINAPNLDISVRAGEPYIMLGCSNRSQKDPFSISHGCISTTTPDANGFIRGDTAPVPGDSGGGCFSAETGKLVAINVAADTRNGNRAVLVPVSAMISILVDHHQKDVQDLMPDFMEGDGEDQFT